MLRHGPWRSMWLGIYLAALLLWFMLGYVVTERPAELLVWGDWLALPSQPEARRQVLRDLFRSTYRLPRSMNSQSLSTVTEAQQAQHGWVLDLELMLPLVEQALPGSRIYPFFRQVNPEWSYEDQERLKSILGMWSSASGGTGSRAKNVQLACAAIDGCIVWPGMIFSFNEATGPTTLERGYENAVVIVHDTFVQGPGGGVCQVASTLYCALQEAELKIIERHRHSLPVGYVPKGQDATVSFGILDLRFENDTGWPVLIEARSDGYSVWVKLYTIDWS